MNVYDPIQYTGPFNGGQDDVIGREGLLKRALFGIIWKAVLLMRY